MAEYIFYTTEGITLTPHGDEIENCQLIGKAFGNTPAEALNNLLNENPWIIENGYNPNNLIINKLDSQKNNSIAPDISKQ